MSAREWSVSAVNLPEHASNRIHTDAGAREAGFPGALVAGVTVYAYLTHVPMATWGRPWLESGGGSVRFAAPVHEHDLIVCAPAPDCDSDSGCALDDDELAVDALVDGGSRARARFTPSGGPLPAPRPGEPLDTIEVPLTDRWEGYAARIGDDLELYGETDLVHPAAWPALANDVFKEHLVTGSWIHTKSLIRHHGVAHVGSTAVVESAVVDRFRSRTGDRAVVDVTITVGGRPVASLVHEAIVTVRT